MIPQPLRRLFALLAMVFLFGAIPTAPSYAQSETAKEFLREIYRIYLTDEGDGVDLSSPDKARRYFDEPLAELIMAGRKGLEGAAGRLDFDPFTNAQDHDINSVGLSITFENAERAQGLASFRNLGRQERVTYDLVKTAGGWRIANISWRGREATLRSLLSRPL